MAALAQFLHERANLHNRSTSILKRKVVGDRMKYSHLRTDFVPLNQTSYASHGKRSTAHSSISRTLRHANTGGMEKPPADMGTVLMIPSPATSEVSTPYSRRVLRTEPGR